MNAFGIEHEPLSKSYTKMAPKLAGALRAYDPAKSTSLTMKLRHHAGSHRLAAGAPGKTYGSLSGGFVRDEAKQSRKAAKLLTDGVGRMGRKDRQLP